METNGFSPKKFRSQKSPMQFAWLARELIASCNFSAFARAAIHGQGMAIVGGINFQQEWRGGFCPFSADG